LYIYAEGGKRIIYDDDIYDAVVKPLMKGVSLVAIMDCCHSGTLLDLPYTCTLSQKQFEQLEEEMRENIPLKQQGKKQAAAGLAADAVTAGSNTVLKVLHGTVGAVEKTFDAVEKTLKETAASVEASTGIGGRIKRGYLKLQMDLKELTSITFKIQPRKGGGQRVDVSDDGEPLTVEERRAALVHKFLF
jgi:hypothetical protein